jgi:hypothetical protein
LGYLQTNYLIYNSIYLHLYKTTQIYLTQLN